MITCRRHHLEYRCRQRGYTLDEVWPCVVSEDGDTITVDETHQSYPRVARPMPELPQQQSPLNGPGTELKKLLKYMGIVASPNCSCNARAKKMDEWGPDECEKRIDEIVGWLKEEAHKRKLPFIDYAGRLLVKRAISNAKRTQE